MSRLILTALLATLAAVALARGFGMLSRGTARGRDRLPAIAFGETPMQRLSFVLLVALVAYAAIWGAG